MSSGSKILDRIARDAGVPDLIPVLSERLSSSDLNSVLLAVFRKRTQTVKVQDLLRDSAGLTAPSEVDQRTFHQFDAMAFAAAKEFDAVECSPVCPFGINAVLGSIHQNNVLSASRGSEVMGDPTSAQALESVRRRRALRATGQPNAFVKLCGSHRVMRMQPFDVPGYRPHFRLFSLVTAGRDTGSDTFETEALYEHLAVYLRLLRDLAGVGYRFDALSVEISDSQIVTRLLERAGIKEGEIRGRVKAHELGSSGALLEELGIRLPRSVDDPERELADLAEDAATTGAVARLARVRTRVIGRLRDEFPQIPVGFDLSRLEGLGYYTGLCMKVSATDPSGLRLPFADGGFTGWTQRLLNDRKERLLVSGIGTEAICGRFRT
jgi:histidyl-tRNA synthetase